MSLDDTYLLCVDPRDKKTFGINMGNGTINYESGGKFDQSEKIKQKIERHAYIMQDLLDDIGDEHHERTC